jgi:hypothetical protein
MTGAKQARNPGLLEWREDKDGWEGSHPERAVGIQAGFSPEPRHRLEAYATLLSGVSGDISKCFLTGVPRAHSRHARV